MAILVDPAALHFPVGTGLTQQPTFFGHLIRRALPPLRIDRTLLCPQHTLAREMSDLSLRDITRQRALQQRDLQNRRPAWLPPLPTSATPLPGARNLQRLPDHIVRLPQWQRNIFKTALLAFGHQGGAERVRESLSQHFRLGGFIWRPNAGRSALPTAHSHSSRGCGETTFCVDARGCGLWKEFYGNGLSLMGRSRCLHADRLCHLE